MTSDREDGPRSVLVVAASKHGATAQIADAIAARLASRLPGAVVDRRAAEQVDSFDGVDAVVLGSAVYLGRWRQSARDLIDRHESRLRAIPVWLFSSGPVGDEPRPHEEPADAARLVRRIGAVEHTTFSGRIDATELNLPERLVVRAVKAPVGDYRDWPAVEEWADRIAVTLAGLVAPA